MYYVTYYITLCNLLRSFPSINKHNTIDVVRNLFRNLYHEKPYKNNIDVFFNLLWINMHNTTDAFRNLLWMNMHNTIGLLHNLLWINSHNTIAQPA